MIVPLSASELELLRKIDKGVGDLKEDFDSFKDKEFKDVSERVTALERWRWWLLGLFTAATAIFTFIWSTFGAQVMNEIRGLRASYPAELPAPPGKPR